MNDVMRDRFKRILQALCVYSGLVFLFLCVRRRRREIMILLYHRVNGVKTPARSITDRLSVRPKLFEKQMAFLCRYFRVMSLEDAVRHLKEGKFPKGGAVVTFDDGYADNADVALPILKRWNIPAAVFVATGFAGGEKYFWWDRLETMILDRRSIRLVLDRDDFSANLDLRTRRRRVHAFWEIYHRLRPLDSNLREDLMNGISERLRDYGDLSRPFHASTLTWEALKTLKDMGITLGAHTHSHAMLTSLSADGIRREVNRCRSVLEKHGIGPVEAFAYPVGNEEALPKGIAVILKEAGFTCGLTTIQGRVREGDDPYFLKRINVDGMDSISSFLCKISGVTEQLQKWKHTLCRRMPGGHKTQIRRRPDFSGLQEPK